MQVESISSCANYSVAARVAKPTIMKEARRKVEILYRERSIETAGQLPFQGEMLTLMGEEQKDISWKAWQMQLETCRCGGRNSHQIKRDRNPGIAGRSSHSCSVNKKFALHTYTCAPRVVGMACVGGAVFVYARIPCLGLLVMSLQG